MEVSKLTINNNIFTFQIIKFLPRDPYILPTFSHAHKNLSRPSLIQSLSPRLPLLTWGSRAHILILLMSVSSNLLKENSRDLLREEEAAGDDEVEFPINDKDEEFSITSIRIVLVDSDPKSLCLMKNLMTQFSYQGIKVTFN